MPARHGCAMAGRSGVCGRLPALPLDAADKRQPMEQVFYQLGRDQDISESVQHRLGALLDVPWDEDGFMLTKLTRLIRLASSKGYAVDCQRLLEDLFY